MGEVSAQSRSPYDFPISPGVFQYFASDPIAPMLTLPRVAGDRKHPLTGDLQSQLQIYSDTAVTQVKTDSLFLAIGRHFDDNMDRAARIWLLLQSLHKIIPQTRLRMLSGDHESEACAPYDHTALADIETSHDWLVPLSEFAVSGARLVRQAHAFTMVSPLQSPNSQYWLLQSLDQLGIIDRSSVRLDPLLHRPVAAYPQQGYRMWWYGRELDWHRIDNLQEEDHGRWFPGPLSTKAQFIDFVWSPRSDGVHFRCEEIPTVKEARERGSRYLHAIYSPSSRSITHLDGSIRIYSHEELGHRTDSHLRSCGKVGQRVKTFSVSGELSREALAAVCIGYFVWSFDVARYFGVEVSEQI